MKYCTHKTKTTTPDKRTPTHRHTDKMKCIISLSLLLIGISAHDNDEASRALRFRGDGRDGMFGQGQGMHGGGGRSHTEGNRTEMLLTKCAENGIVCSEVSEEFLTNNCTLPERPDWDRDLLVFVDEHEDRFLRGGPGGGGRGRHNGDGRWGNLTEAEREDMRLKHLTCRCCKDDEENDSE